MAKRQGCGGVRRGRDLRGQRSGARVDGEVERTRYGGLVQSGGYVKTTRRPIGRLEIG
jgi:hypothetical protein